MAQAAPPTVPKDAKALAKENVKDKYGLPLKGLFPVTKDGHRDFDKDRSCCAGGDCICCILFLAAFVAMIIIGIIAWRTGDPRKLYYPIDWDNKMCGMDDMQNRPYLYFPLLMSMNTSLSWCVSSCPTPAPLDMICRGDNQSHAPRPSDLTGQCWLAYESVAGYYSFARCIPKLLDSTNASALMSEYTNIIVRGVRDIYATWWVFLVCGGIAIVVCFIWVWILRCCAGCMVYTAIFLVLSVVAAVAAYVLYYGIGEYREAVALDAPRTSSIIILVIGGILALLEIIMLLILCVMCSRIRLAVAIVKVASRVIASMPMMLIAPLITILLMVGFSALILAIWVFLVSAGGTMEVVNGSREFTFSWPMRYLTIYLIFFFFWGIFFLYGMTQMVISGAIHIWFFTKKEKDKLVNPVRFPLCKSFGRAMRYHVGGVAFGSLIIAIVATIRVIVLYFQRKLKGTENKPLQWCLACLQCCLGCLQKILQYLTKNAYILMALNGKGFCRSGIDAFQLIMRNILRVASITGVGEYLIFAGKLVVSVATALIGMLIIRPSFIKISTALVKDVYYWWLPVLCIFVISFFLASAFFTVYGFTMDTLFVDFVEDEERLKNDPSGTYAPYAPQELKDRMDDVLVNRAEERARKQRLLEEEFAQLDRYQEAKQPGQGPVGMVPMAGPAPGPATPPASVAMMPPPQTGYTYPPPTTPYPYSGPPSGPAPATPMYPDPRAPASVYPDPR